MEHDARSRPDREPAAAALNEGGSLAPPDMGERGLDRPLAEFIHRRPVSCGPGATLRSVLEAMQRERVGSVVVVDAFDCPLGVFTLGDVLSRVALPQTPLDTPVASVMSTRLFTLPSHAPAFEAALLMAREGIRHVPLLEQGRLAGVVSESRLFAMWRRSIGAVRAAIVEALVRTIGQSQDSPGARHLAQEFLGLGAAVPHRPAQPKHAAGRDAPG
jgi:CBS domain-containing protein